MLPFDHISCFSLFNLLKKFHFGKHTHRDYSAHVDFTFALKILQTHNHQNLAAVRSYDSLRYILVSGKSIKLAWRKSIALLLNFARNLLKIYNPL